MILVAHDARGARSKVDLDERNPIGAGGEGSIYAVRNASATAVKILTAPTAARRAKIEAMMARPPVPEAARTVSFAWPQALVTDASNTFLGFAMPRIDLNRYCPLDWFLLATQRKTKKLRGNCAQDYPFRVGVARNLAMLVGQLNAAGHALVDLKPANVLVDRIDGLVTIVDCDGARVVGPSATYPATVATDEYLAPEFHGTVHRADFRQDRFALAMIIFRLLDNDLYPMSGVPESLDAPSGLLGRIKAGLFTTSPAARMARHSASLQHYFSDETRDLFRRSFLAAALLRPAPRDWGGHLDRMMRDLRHCSAGKHVSLAKGCPWCDRAEGRAGPEKT